MERHLRALPDTPDGPTYVVGRTKHVRPGTPYVMARCVDRSVAVIFSLAGQQVATRAEMVRDPALASALAAWDVGDDSLFARERKAREAFRRTGSSQRDRGVRWHPSRAGGHAES
jgi:hypothetical protein